VTPGICSATEESCGRRRQARHGLTGNPPVGVMRNATASRNRCNSLPTTSFARSANACAAGRTDPPIGSVPAERRAQFHIESHLGRSPPARDPRATGRPDLDHRLIGASRFGTMPSPLVTNGLMAGGRTPAVLYASETPVRSGRSVPFWPDPAVLNVDRSALRPHCALPIVRLG
jgi:hypothetical protein